MQAHHLREGCWRDYLLVSKSTTSLWGPEKGVKKEVKEPKTAAKHFGAKALRPPPATNASNRLAVYDPRKYERGKLLLIGRLYYQRRKRRG